LKVLLVHDLLPHHATEERDNAAGLMMMMIAFITINSGLVPLIEGLCAPRLYDEPALLLLCRFTHYTKLPRVIFYMFLFGAVQ